MPKVIDDEYRYPIEGRPGWFLTGFGDPFFDPWHDLEARQEVFADLQALNTSPMVSGVSIDGQRPTAEQLAAVEEELHKAPESVIRAWRARGGRLEVVPGNDARRHPLAAGDKPAGGFHSQWAQGLIVIAAAQALVTVLHELGHALDWDYRFSTSAEWRRICELDKHRSAIEPALKTFKLSYHSDSLSEMFAESFGMRYHSPETCRRLPPAMRRFIEGAVERA